MAPNPPEVPPCPRGDGLLVERGAATQPQKPFVESVFAGVDLSSGCPSSQQHIAKSLPTIESGHVGPMAELPSTKASTQRPRSILTQRDLEVE